VITPRLAAARAGNALLAASSASGSGLRPALSDALLADRLDPVSDRGLLVAATVEIHLHHNERARRYLLAAVERQPTDGVAWQRLAVQDLVLGDRHDAVIAGRRALALDPHGVAARALAANLDAAGSAR
jgi:tetratricopeptide (TPR) repeat protein